MLALARSALITGEAGAGKSHLLADVCASQLAEGSPALLFLGSSLAEADVWPQLIAQLGLPAHYTRDAFLGALDAAGEAAGCRALLMIDAINERHGTRIWPDRLGGFLVDAAKFPHVAVALSCRSTFIDRTVPDLGSRAPVILKHSGFSASDARAFLRLRGIVLAEHPFLDVELGNPLFLKTCCDALDREGKKRFPKGIRGVTAVFSMFRQAACDAIERRLNLVRMRREPSRAIDALATEIERTRSPYIPVERATEIVDAIRRGQDADSDLLHALVTEGVLSIEPAIDDAGTSSQDFVRFTFERFADHVVARSILQDALVNDKLPQPLPADNTLALAFVNAQLPWGVYEALSVQLPERTGVELPDAVTKLNGVMFWNRISVDSVQVRAPASVSSRTLELLEDAEGRDACWDILVRLSVDPDSEFGAGWLHDLLKPAPMPERDADWSTYVANFADDDHGPEGSAAIQLVAWARDPQVRESDPEVARNAAVTLTWFLSTSSRRARDTATMGLVNLLVAFPQLALDLLDRFDGVDDPYVGERLSGAIYGAALQGQWETEVLGSIAGKVVALFFERGPLPVDLLWRDHLSSLLRYAAWRGVPSPAGVHTQPPFSSKWPLEPVPDALIKTYTRTYGRESVMTDEIVSSTGEYGDFGSYVIKYAVLGWSAAERGVPSPPGYGDLYLQWKGEFDQYATSEMIELFDRMDELRKGNRDWSYASGDTAERHKQLEGEFQALLGDERFERYRVMARHWRPFDHHGVDLPADFNVAWAQRWVCMQAHELGWSEALHGDFDRHCGHHRNEHKRERIGKRLFGNGRRGVFPEA